MSIGSRIKERRLAMGHTQEELATELGLQKSAIAKYENGRVENIKRSVLFKMAEILDCSPAYLLDWDSITKHPGLGELRRLELLTDDKQEIAELERILKEKNITRQELAKILFTVRVRPGFRKADFGISGDVCRDSGLKAFKTCELVKELERREGVEAWTAEPYTELSLPVHGPAVVLVVTD